MQNSPFDLATATALDATYSQFGTGAVYTPAGGSAKLVTIVVVDRSATINDQTNVRKKTYTLKGWIRAAEIARPKRGDTLKPDGDPITFRIVPGSLILDGLEWEFEAVGDVATEIGDVNTFPNR